MEQVAKNYLAKKGYLVGDKAISIINTCDNWYSTNSIEGFHNRVTVQGEKYELEKLNFAKRGCSDEANLCEIVNINCGEDKNDGINKLLESNKFKKMYRKQLERVPAHGTVAAYIYLNNAILYDDNSVKGGDICINYVNAYNYYPITVVNDEVQEAAFCGVDYKNGKKRTTLVIFTHDEENYKSTTVIFNENGVIDSEIEMMLGNVKPFCVMQNAEVNNLKDMEGYGLPKILGAIPVLKVLDLCFNILFGDLDKGDKLLLVNELLCKFDDTGKPITPNKQIRKVFALMGNKLPSQDNIIKEYNPEIRIDDITKAFELCLSLLSMMFGFGTKQYTFENGQIKTATEYIGDRQDKMQELNKQREEARSYITDMCRALMWFSNQYKETNYNLDEEIIIDFDDSYIEDKITKLETMRQDALTMDVPIIKKWYMMERYNLTEEEARKYIEEQVIEEEEEDE